MNLADKTVLNIFAKSSEAVLLMLSSVVMVRYFSKTDYGTFLQVMLITNTVIMFTFMGLPQSIYYFFPLATNRQHFVIRNVLLSLGIGLLASLLVYSARHQLVLWLNNPLLAEYGWMVALLIFFRAPAHFQEPLLISSGSLLVNSGATLTWNVIFFVPIILASFASVSLGVLLKTMLFFSGVQLCIYLGLMGWVSIYAKKSEFRAPGNKPPGREIGFKEQFKYALPLGVSSYIGIVGRQMDQYIVSAFFTPTDFAVYSRGAMKIPVLSDIQYVINDIMMPQYVQAYQKQDIRAFLNIFHTCIKNVAKINFPVFALLFATAPSIMTFLYTEEYVGAASILRVYLLFLIVQIAVYGVIPRASGNTACIMHATIIFSASNILLSLLLIRPFGPIGAAIATIVSVVLISAYYLRHACKILKVSWSEIFPWRTLGQLLGISLISSLPVYAVLQLGQHYNFDLFGRLLVSGLVYAYSYIFLMMRKSLITNDEFAILARWLRCDVQWILRKLTFTA